MAIDVNIVNPFINSVINAFETMAYISPKRTNLSLKSDNKMLGDISGVMSLSGKGNGVVVISFPEKLACQIFSNMINMKADSPLDPAELNDDVEDSIREILNLVSGGAKSEFSNTELEFTIGIPSIVSGKNHKISRDPEVPCIVVNFEACGEKFELELSLS